MLLKLIEQAHISFVLFQKTKEPPPKTKEHAKGFFVETGKKGAKILSTNSYGDYNELCETNLVNSEGRSGGRFCEGADFARAKSSSLEYLPVHGISFSPPNDGCIPPSPSIFLLDL
jgi:hypothetical protein